MENQKQRLQQLNNTKDFVDFFVVELKNDRKVKVAGVDIDGILRGKIMSKEKFFSCIKTGGFGFCSVIFEWDMHDKTYQQQVDGEGYGDILAMIDLKSYRRIPWEDQIPFFLVDFHDQHTNEAYARCPRNLLKKVIANVEKADLGVATAGIEFEFFNFQETPDSMETKKYLDLKPLTPGMFGYSLLRPVICQDYFDSIFDMCLDFGINVEALHTETGPGVYEAALRYSNALELADNAQLFKTSVKQLGLLRPRMTQNSQPAIYPSFMAKPSSSLPGCSGHTHLSLIRKSADGKSAENLFYDEKDEWNMSPIMKHFVAGLLAGLPVLLPLYAPTINSYKRLVENYWAPVRVCWGLENRTAAIRVISPKTSGSMTCSPMSTRIEMRVPGADINAHLVVAACFASGLYGIMKKLPLCPPVVDEGKEEQAARLAKSLGEATEMMAQSELAKEMLGEDFVRHYVRTRREEWEKWEQEVTQYEVARYFELV